MSKHHQSAEPDCGTSHGAHDHSHGKMGHVHGASSFGKAFAIGIGLNAAYVATQVFYGLAAHSVALLADAIHNLGDVFGLLMAWIAMHLAKRGPTQTRTYGWGRGTILAALTNAVLLLLGCGAIAIEAIRRFSHPQPVAAGIVMWVAAAGIAINGATALMFMRGRKGDLNVRGAFVHMASDAVVASGVVLAGWLIQLTHWLWLDAVTSLLIVLVIVWGTWGLLRDSMNMAMDVVPGGIQLQEVEHALLELPDVIDVHDLHIWALSTTQTALTAHLTQIGTSNTGGNSADALIRKAGDVVRSRFNIGHSTFQVETADALEACHQRVSHTA